VDGETNMGGKNKTAECECHVLLTIQIALSNHICCLQFTTAVALL
jgi:hypothetical protein